MAFKITQEFSMRELLEEALNRPDFSFLEGWTGGDSFFPRLNGAEVNRRRFTKLTYTNLREAVDRVERIGPPLSETSPELKRSGGDFSNAISVFHRDGKPSLVAIPATESTRRALRGFLLARELFGGARGKQLMAELSGLSVLARSARELLEANFWKKRLAKSELLYRRARQLTLLDSMDSERSLKALERAISDYGSEDQPTNSQWLRAVGLLESLEGFDDSASVATIAADSPEKFRAAMATMANGFQRLDYARQKLNEALELWRASEIERLAERMSLREFAKNMRRTGFSRKVFEECFPYGGSKRELTLADAQIIAAQSTRPPSNLETKSIGLINEYLDGQKLLLKSPPLDSNGKAFEKFLEAAHRFVQLQQKPLPLRSQWEFLWKLFEDSPEELRLLGSNAQEISKLVDAANGYLKTARLRQVEKDISSSFEDANSYFQANPAAYQSLLSNLGFNALTLEQQSGFLGRKLSREINDIELNLTGLKAQPRSYQSFGVKFSLRQKRVILGDEMGLGKTLVALGLACHLANDGASRALVVVPLAVLENWRREILKHTEFEPLVIHGKTFEKSVEKWLDRGGLAVATFESVQKLNGHKRIGELSQLALTIVDEAHYLKNPATKRSQGIVPWLNGSQRVLLMTGTPLENSLDEFKVLLSYVQPQLKLPSNTFAYGRFRKAIAPAYLRRNQKDVLQELPELTETEETIELSAADREYYKRALKKGDWHGARRAKVLSGSKSATVRRIQEIIAEANGNGHKVLVFSYYLDSIGALRSAIAGGKRYEALTGSLGSLERQREVDKFTLAAEPGVLFAQSETGGTGLNIQAASVVIILEPQAKPSLEDQMVGRALRMGQTKPVEVFRLIAKDTIDERWLHMQEEKRKIFDATAGQSDAAALDEEMAKVDKKNMLQEEREVWKV